APAGVGQVLECGEHAGRVCEHVIRATALVHGGSTGQKSLDVDAGECGGQQSDSGKHAEAASDVGRYGQSGNALLVGEPTQYAAFRIGGEDEMAAVVVVIERGAEPFAHDHELRHCLRSRAGLADDVVERGARV